MSGQYYNYLGVFLDLRVIKIEIEEVTLECQKHGKVKEGVLFCPSCGQSTQKKMNPSTEYPNYYEIVEDTEYEDIFIDYDVREQEDQTILIYSSDGNSLEHDGFIEIQESHVKEELRRFELKYKSCIDYLRGHIHVQSVNVKFGFVNYYNYKEYKLRNL